MGSYDKRDKRNTGFNYNTDTASFSRIKTVESNSYNRTEKMRNPERISNLFPIDRTDLQQSCSICGQIVTSNHSVLFGNTLVCENCKPAYIQKIKEGIFTPQELQYAGFWIRLVAKLIDGLVMGIIIFFMILLPILGIILFLGANEKEISPPPFFTSSAMNFFSAIPSICYGTFFIGAFGATPGKMIVGIKIASPCGKKIGYGKAFFRVISEWAIPISISLGDFVTELNTGKWVLSLIFCAGYLMAAFDPEKKTIYDLICKTRVIKR